MRWDQVPKEQILLLRDFAATEMELATINALAEARSLRGAARLLNQHQKSIWKKIKRVVMRAEKGGISLRMEHMTHPMPYGQQLSGISELRRGNGELVLRWTKTSKDQDALAHIAELIAQGYIEDIPQVAPVAPPRHNTIEVLPMLSLWDFHIGMYAWAVTAGDLIGWDIEEALKIGCGYVNYALRKLPRTRKVLLVNGGDFRHWDGHKPVTPKSGHILDAAGQWDEVCIASIQLQTYMVNQLLRRHQVVDIIEVAGNHDKGSTALNRAWMRKFYEKEPRVNVDPHPGPLHSYQYEKVGLWFTHGDTFKPEDMPSRVPAHCPEMWGRTQHRYAHLGDKHHDHMLKAKDNDGLTTEQHATFASRDRWTSDMGFLSKRHGKVIIYDPAQGEVERFLITPHMARLAGQ